MNLESAVGRLETSIYLTLNTLEELIHSYDSIFNHRNSITIDKFLGHIYHELSGLLRGISGTGRDKMLRLSGMRYNRSFHTKIIKRNEGTIKGTMKGIDSKGHKETSTASCCWIVYSMMRRKYDSWKLRAFYKWRLVSSGYRRTVDRATGLSAASPSDISYQDSKDDDSSYRSQSNGGSSSAWHEKHMSSSLMETLEELCQKNRQSLAPTTQAMSPLTQSPNLTRASSFVANRAVQVDEGQIAGNHAENTSSVGSGEKRADDNETYLSSWLYQVQSSPVKSTKSNQCAHCSPSKRSSEVNDANLFDTRCDLQAIEIPRSDTERHPDPAGISQSPKGHTSYQQEELQQLSGEEQFRNISFINQFVNTADVSTDTADIPIYPNSSRGVDACTITEFEFIDRAEAASLNEENNKDKFSCTEVLHHGAVGQVSNGVLNRMWESCTSDSTYVDKSDSDYRYTSDLDQQVTSDPIDPYMCRNEIHETEADAPYRVIHDGQTDIIGTPNTVATVDDKHETCDAIMKDKKCSSTSTSSGAAVSDRPISTWNADDKRRKMDESALSDKQSHSTMGKLIPAEGKSTRRSSLSEANIYSLRNRDIEIGVNNSTRRSSLSAMNHSKSVPQLSEISIRGVYDDTKFTDVAIMDEPINDSCGNDHDETTRDINESTRRSSLSEADIYSLRNRDIEVGVNNSTRRSSLSAMNHSKSVPQLSEISIRGVYNDTKFTDVAIMDEPVNNSCGNDHDETTRDINEAAVEVDDAPAVDRAGSAIYYSRDINAFAADVEETAAVDNIDGGIHYDHDINDVADDVEETAAVDNIDGGIHYDRDINDVADEVNGAAAVDNIDGGIHYDHDINDVGDDRIDVDEAFIGHHNMTSDIDVNKFLNGSRNEVTGAVQTDPSVDGVRKTIFPTYAEKTDVGDVVETTHDSYAASDQMNRSENDVDSSNNRVYGSQSQMSNLYNRAMHSSPGIKLMPTLSEDTDSSTESPPLEKSLNFMSPAQSSVKHSANSMKRRSTTSFNARPNAGQSHAVDHDSTSWAMSLNAGNNRFKPSEVRISASASGVSVRRSSVAVMDRGRRGDSSLSLLNTSTKERVDPSSSYHVENSISEHGVDQLFRAPDLMSLNSLYAKDMDSLAIGAKSHEKEQHIYAKSYNNTSVGCLSSPVSRSLPLTEQSAIPSSQAEELSSLQLSRTPSPKPSDQSYVNIPTDNPVDHSQYTGKSYLASTSQHEDIRGEASATAVPNKRRFTVNAYTMQMCSQDSKANPPVNISGDDIPYRDLVSKNVSDNRGTLRGASKAPLASRRASVSISQVRLASSVPPPIPRSPPPSSTQSSGASTPTRRSRPPPPPPRT